MAKLSVPFTYASMPAAGFRLSYRPVGSTAPYQVHPTNFFSSPAEVSGLIAQDYEGLLQADCGGGRFGAEVAFKTEAYSCPGISDFNLSATIDKIVVSQIVFAIAPTVAQTLSATLINVATAAQVGAPLSLTVQPNGSITQPAPCEFTGLQSFTNYAVRIANACAPGSYKEKTIETDGVIPTMWVEDTSMCEQDEVFALQNEYAGLSSPGALLYDEISGRIYVADNDDTTSNVAYFNPKTFSGVLTKIPVDAAIAPAQPYYAVAVDAQYRRLYFTGLNSGGLIVYHIATETYQRVAFGTDNKPFNRLSIRVFEDSIYTGDNVKGEVVIINRDTLTIRNTIPFSSISESENRLDDYHLIRRPNGHIWLICGYNTVGDVAVYSADFSVLHYKIALPGIAPEIGGYNSRYRQAAYYDAVNDKVYVGDSGSGKLFIIDGATRTVVHTKTFALKYGSQNLVAVGEDDPVTSELYLRIQGYTGSGSNPNYRFYKMNRQTYELEKLYKDQSITGLVHEPGTANVWGTFSGNRQWDGGSWNNDGKILKYAR